ncbi:efflux RND transporter periplasmic adaptor subunit [Brevundimonas aveniformis]|uniref:efflux RND transporter periplasmic adaptor subunit n=1 Tax=Brevundimonas aveniformis TaxID=370977 RepID=UPI0024939F16|nr:efflux RND transporter periplasmic adaptor subunit [Brevundimonas aveniformis]
MTRSTQTSSRSPRFTLPGFRSNGRWLWIGAALVLMLGLAWAIFGRGEEAEPYRTEAVTRGDIVSSVSASGALEALDTVQVGSQLSGQVTQVLVDYNDTVRRGQALAYLDPQTYDSRMEQGQAQVASANAQLAQQRAGLAQAQANLELAQAEYNRQQFLFDRGIAAQAALDTAAAQLSSARAGVMTAQAQIRSAGAGVAQQRAALNATRVERGRTVITAPIDGVIIDRQIEPGQTVASGLNVAVLFTLARDLTRLQAELLVDEADIGQVRVGQPVRFTVDAFPDNNYDGVVTQVRALPTTENNVVAYTVVVEAENTGARLMPGMTANADIILSRQENVLLVPTSALRFTPAGADVGDVSGNRRGGFRGPPGGGGGVPGMGGGERRQGGGMAGRVIEQLELTDAQRRQVEPILTRALQSARQSGGGQGGGGRGAGRAARAEALNAAFDEIRPLLNAEQQARLETLRTRMAGGGQRGIVWVLRDGEPVQVPVRIGASDGQRTEILGGELQDGDQVITGGGPRPDAADRERSQGSGGGVRVRM